MNLTINALPERPGMPGDLNYRVTRTEWQYLVESNFTCDCCHFVSVSTDDVPHGFMEVINVNGTVLVACALCASAFRITRRVQGSAQSSPTHAHGRLCYCDSVAQADISHLVRLRDSVRFLSQREGEENRREAYSVVYETLKKDCDTLADIHPPRHPLFDDSDPIMSLTDLGDLITTSQQNHVDSMVLFQHFRYIPDARAFATILNYWFTHQQSYFDALLAPLLNELTDDL